MAITAEVQLKHDPAFAGQLGNMEVANKISKVNGTGAVIAYGLGVVRDGAEGMKLPETTSTAADFLGVPERAYQDITVDGVFGTNANQYASVITMGAVWVKVCEDVAAGDAACLSVKADTAGQFCKTAKDTEAVAIPNAIFREGASEGGLALIAFRIGG